MQNGSMGCQSVARVVRRLDDKVLGRNRAFAVVVVVVVVATAVVTGLLLLLLLIIVGVTIVVVELSVVVVNCGRMIERFVNVN